MSPLDRLRSDARKGSGGAWTTGWTRALVTARSLGRSRTRAVLLCGLLGFAGSAGFAALKGIPAPSVHDEFSYLLGADTFNEGRLTNPTHRHWWHFETMHVIHEPTYQSKYPPGQALLLGLGQWLGGHPVLGLWIGAGLLAAALTWALLVWLPPQWALLSAVLATMQLSWFSYWTQSYWGGAVAATGGALALGAIRQFWIRPRPRDGAILGLGWGIMALSRPFEGALLGLLIGAALVYRFAAGGARRGLVLRCAIPAIVVVSLVLVWQCYFNFRVTESPLTMPYQVDDREYGAAPTFLFQAPGPPPTYRHAVIESFWMEWGRLRHERSRELPVFLASIPTKTGYLLLFFLGPGMIAFLGLRGTPARGWVAFAGAGLGLVIGASLLTKGTYAHYVAPVTLLFYVMLGSGLRGLHRRGRKPRRINLALAVVVAMIATVSISATRFLAMPDRPFAVARTTLVSTLETLPGKHLVVVRYGPDHNHHEEWVYNRADIDASKIVWAREMTPDLDRELLEYFPERTVWLLSVDGRASTVDSHPLAKSEGPETMNGLAAVRRALANLEKP